MASKALSNSSSSLPRVSLASPRADGLDSRPPNLDVNLLPGRAVGGAGVEPEPEPQPAEPEEPEPQPAEPKARPRGIIYVVHLHVCYKKLT